MSCTCPSADHARQVHCGGSALLFVLITSCLSSSTMILPSRSYMMRRNQQRQSNQSLLTSSKGSMTEVNAPKINYTITYWSRLELRNSLCYHQRIQLALNVTSLPFALVLKCSIDRSWNVKVEVFYPNLDTGASGGTQPVTVGAEAEGIDGVTTVQGIEVLAFIQVPQHGLAVLDKENTLE